jgi:hypothetical protein
LVIVAPINRDYLDVLTYRIVPYAIAVALVGAIWPRLEALAQTTPGVPCVAYAAEKGCPTGAAFAAAVERRGRRVLVVDRDSPSTIRISIEAEPGGYKGTLRTGSLEGGKREVRGATCTDVLDALAVVTVGMLRPPEPIPTSEATSEPPPSKVATGTPEQATTASTPPVWLPTESPPVGSVSATPDAVRVEAGTLRFDANNAMSVFGGVTTGIVPSVALPRFDFQWSRTNLVTAPDGHRYRVFPTVRLHGTLFANGAPYRSRYGTTEANGIGGGVDLCDPLYYDPAGLQLQLCAEIMIGYFGVVTTNQQGVAGPIREAGVGTAGFGLDLAYNMGRHFHLGLEVGAAAVLGPLTALAPDGSQIFRSSLFSLHGLVGAGGQF